MDPNIDWTTIASALASIVTAIATVVIACLTKKLTDENRLLREITEDKPSLVITKRGDDSGTIIITNLSRGSVALHCILLADSYDIKAFESFWKNRNWFYNQPVILPSTCALKVSWEFEEIGDKPLIHIRGSEIYCQSAFSGYRSSLYPQIKVDEVNLQREKVSCIGVIFSYSSVNKPYLLIAEFENGQSFPKSVKRIVISDIKESALTTPRA